MPKTYYAWMLRINQVSNDELPVWRVSLEDPHTQKRLGFDTLEAFYEYLQESIERRNHKSFDAKND